MDVLFHHIAQKSGGHAKEEDGEAEGPFGGAFGKPYMLSNFLTEHGPAVYGSDTEVEEQSRNGGTHPFVLTVFHIFSVSLSYFMQRLKIDRKLFLFYSGICDFSRAFHHGFIRVFLRRLICLHSILTEEAQAL